MNIDLPIVKTEPKENFILRGVAMLTSLDD